MKSAQKKSRNSLARVVRVPLRDRAYALHIGPGILQNLDKILAETLFRGQKAKVTKLAGAASSKRAFLIYDDRLTDIQSAIGATLEQAQWEVNSIPVTAGESLKDMESVYELYGQLLKARANRDSVILALGGGTIGDAVGFVASTYLRGVKWIGLPSTLLAQVDSSIGGKTGINHPLGKNLVGTIYQPAAVVIDTELLATLDARDVVSGFAEVLKTGLILDPKLFAYLMAATDSFLQLDTTVLSRAVEQAAAWKAKIVAKDEFDRKGVREILNFGHTFGHALENATGYGLFRHGEAILWGMRFAVALSEVRKTLKPERGEEIDAYLATLDCPPLPEGFGPDVFMERMKQDKKVKDGRTRFVLLKNIGKTVLDNQIEETHLREAYALMLSREESYG